MSASGKPRRSTMSIGQVLDALKGDFPDVTVSKIRFLESEGLIEPARTASGYRTFAQRDIDRLRTILTMQRDEYLPLKVIRERLLAGETAATPAAHPATPAPAPAPATPTSAAPAPSSVPDRDILAAPRPLALTAADVADQTGLDLGQVSELRSFGVLCEHGEPGSFDADDLVVAEIARDLMKIGIDARHLKGLRRAAEQEASLIEQVVAPVLRHRRDDARAQAAETVVELADLVGRLRHTYVAQALREAVGGNGRGA